MRPETPKALRHIISDVTTRVQGGETFHESIAKHPRVFDRLFVSMVKAGEHGGLLAEILDRLAGFLEASARLRKGQVGHDLRVIVISIAFAITTFLIVKVVPIFGEIFKDFGMTSRAHPVPHRRERFHARQIVHPHRWPGGSVLRPPPFLRTGAALRQLWDKWKLKLPVFGPLMHKICMSRFARTFAQLIRSGVPILEVLIYRRWRPLATTWSGNQYQGCAEDVEKGDNTLRRHDKKPIFPPMMLRMVSAGEATGKIDTMLEKMADFWDEEIEAMLDARR